MAKRLRPLQANHHDAPDRAGSPGPPALTGAAAEAEAEMDALAHDVVVGGGAPATTSSHDPHAEARRQQRLAAGVQGLRAGGGTLKLNERILMVLAGVIAPLGLVAVIVGWYGAAHTPNLYEQIPYAISGGLFGLGLVFLGAFFYFAHWMTELVKEHRAQSAAVVEAIGRLETAMRTGAGPAAGSADGAGEVAAHAADGTLLVATERGTMAHRPDCVVVAGKRDLRAVAPGEGLAPCKLCDPYAALVN